MVITKKQKETIQELIKWQALKLPVRQGDIVGEIIVVVDDERHKINLLAANDIMEKSLWEKLVAKRKKGY